MSKDITGFPISFEQAVDMLGDSVKMYAQKYSKSSGIDSEDLLQEGLIAVENAFRTYDSSYGASFKTYALRCAKNAILDCLDKMNAKKRIPADMTVSLDNGIDLFTANDISDQFVAEDLMKNLSKMEQIVLSYHIAGYSAQEIAQKVGRSVKSVQNALTRAKTKFKDNMPA